MSDAEGSEAKTLRIVRDEKLTHYSWFETDSPRADEVGIRRDGNGWLVYSTDERAAEGYRRRHEVQEPALVDFLEKARATTKYFQRSAERTRREAADPPVS